MQRNHLATIAGLVGLVGLGAAYVAERARRLQAEDQANQAQAWADQLQTRVDQAELEAEQARLELGAARLQAYADGTEHGRQRARAELAEAQRAQARRQIVIIRPAGWGGDHRLN